VCVCVCMCVRACLGDLCGEWRYIASVVRNLGTRWDWVVTFTLCQLSKCMCGEHAPGTHSTWGWLWQKTSSDV